MEWVFGVSFSQQRKGLGLSPGHLGSPASLEPPYLCRRSGKATMYVVHISRAMIGYTNSTEAAPGTIRGDFSVHISRYGGPDTLSLPKWGKEG